MKIKKFFVVLSLIIFPIAIIIVIVQKFRGKKVIDTFDVFDTETWIGM